MNIRPKKFALFGNVYQAKKSAHVIRLLALLEKRKAQVYVYKEFHRFLTGELHMELRGASVFDDEDFPPVDMVLSLGGDGTFLKAASHVGHRNIPILGINTGRLGFLADVSPEEMEAAFDDIFNRNYQVEDRSVLQVTSTGAPLKGHPYGLNEIALLKRDSSSMITIHTSINGAYLTTYQADGLVIATPTGSTAYSLSIGGPVIVPHSNPIVINDDWEITLDVESRSHNFLVAIDGRSETCREGTRLTIRKADYYIKVVKRPNHIFFHTLRDKMMWGVDGRG